MNKRCELVKRYYNRGLWKKKAVQDAVTKGWITAEEYAEIVGEPYVDEAGA